MQSVIGEFCCGVNESDAAVLHAAESLLALGVTEDELLGHDVDVPMLRRLIEISQPYREARLVHDRQERDSGGYYGSYGSSKEGRASMNAVQHAYSVYQADRTRILGGS